MQLGNWPFWARTAETEEKSAFGIRQKNHLCSVGGRKREDFNEKKRHFYNRDERKERLEEYPRGPSPPFGTLEENLRTSKKEKECFIIRAGHEKAAAVEGKEGRASGEEQEKKEEASRQKKRRSKSTCKVLGGEKRKCATVKKEKSIRKGVDREEGRKAQTRSPNVWRQPRSSSGRQPSQKGKGGGMVIEKREVVSPQAEKGFLGGECRALFGERKTHLLPPERRGQILQKERDQPFPSCREKRKVGDRRKRRDHSFWLRKKEKKFTIFINRVGEGKRRH